MGTVPWRAFRKANGPAGPEAVRTNSPSANCSSKDSKMLKWGLLILLLSTAAAEAVESSDKLSVNLAGAGSRTCAYWLSSPSHKAEGTVWIYGFWSGLNY